MFCHSETVLIEGLCALCEARGMMPTFDPGGPGSPLCPLKPWTESLEKQTLLSGRLTRVIYNQTKTRQIYKHSSKTNTQTPKQDKIYKHPNKGNIQTPTQDNKHPNKTNIQTPKQGKHTNTQTRHHPGVTYRKASKSISARRARLALFTLQRAS